MKHNDRTAKGKMVASVCLYLFVFVTLTKCGKLATSTLTLIDIFLCSLTPRIHGPYHANCEKKHWRQGPPLRGSEGPQVGSQVGKQVYNVVIRWRTGCGKAYLSMDVATESEVADTTGSTATGAPL